jgi:hypothetical protein
MAAVVGHTQDNGVASSLSNLRRAQADDPTLKNLLQILTAKLELCSRLPVFEWEAAHEGDPNCATTFRRLAEEERRSCSYLIDCLQKHLDRRASLAGGGQ